MEKKHRHAVHDHIVNRDNDVFLRSLDEITPEQLGGEAVKHRRTGSDLVSFIIERTVYFIAVAVFLVCVVELAISLWEQFSGEFYYRQMTDSYSASHLLDGSAADGVTPSVSTLSSSVTSEPFVAGVSQPDPGIKIEATEYNETVEELKASIASLKRRYPDIYGWIYIEDTNIDYPIVRGTDNSYYLKHAFTGEPLSVGAIFADFTVRDYIMDNYNTVIYGHNLTGGSMFNHVMKFAMDEEFFNTHNIYIYTPTGLYEYEPFNISVFSYKFKYFRTGFESGEDFLSFIDSVLESPIYKKDMDFTVTDRIVTLSTCTKLGIHTLRYCLQGKLIRVIE